MAWRFCGDVSGEAFVSRKGMGDFELTFPQGHFEGECRARHFDRSLLDLA